MTAYSAPYSAATWTDAAARGTWAERALLAAGRLLTQAAADSARRRAERRDASCPLAETQRERMRADAVRLGVLRR